MRKTTIQINNVWSHVHDMPIELHRQINKWEDRLTGPYGITNKQGDILSGVLPLLFGDDIVHQTIIDQRVVPCIPIGIPAFVDRDYQYEAIKQALVYHRGILKLPMGSGKSIIAAGLAGALNCAQLILVHKANLVEDLAATISALLREPVGKIHGKANDSSKRITCATYKSLYARKELLPFIQSREAIIADECHVIPALTHFATLLNTENAYYRFGLSATPLIREDERDIHTVGLLGPIIYEVQNQQLVDQGHVVPPEVIWLNTVTNTTATDYQKGYDQAIVNNVMRNQAIKQILSVCDKPAIVFVKTHAHQKELLQLLEPMFDRKVFWVNQSTPIDERQHVVDALKQNELCIVIATIVFNEGMNVPNLQTVINATGAASLIGTIQPSGRGARPFANKHSFKLYDFNDQGHTWFEDHTAQRYRAYQEAGYKVQPPTKTAKVVPLERPRPTSVTQVRENAGLVYCLLWFGLVLALLGTASFLRWLLTGDKQ